jgi:hypothetical protein
LIASVSSIVQTEGAYDKLLKERSSGSVKLIEPYIDLKTRILHHCKIHDQYFHTSHYNTRLYHTGGCPECGFENTIKGRFTLTEVSSEDFTFKVQGYEPQALKYLIEKKRIKPSSILAGVGVVLPSIKYTHGKVNRKYHPDIFIPSKNKLIEVKSLWTLLSLENTFYVNARRAKACIAQGYKFQLLVMTEQGKRVKVPKDWYMMRYSEACKHFNLTLQKTELTF